MLHCVEPAHFQLLLNAIKSMYGLQNAPLAFEIIKIRVFIEFPPNLPTLPFPIDLLPKMIIERCPVFDFHILPHLFRLRAWVWVETIVGSIVRVIRVPRKAFSMSFDVNELKSRVVGQSGNPIVHHRSFSWSGRWYDSITTRNFDNKLLKTLKLFNGIHP